MTEWEFKSFRPRNPRDRFPIFGRFPIRRACPFTGSERDALAFARRACEHLSGKGVIRVEAWSRHGEATELHGNVTFRLAISPFICGVVPMNPNLWSTTALQGSLGNGSWYCSYRSRRNTCCRVRSSHCRLLPAD